MATQAAEVAANAAQGFHVYQCEECAQKMQNELTMAGHSGLRLEIKGKGGRDFIVCMSYDGGKTTITQNGKHVGIRVGEIVFDNLHPNALPFDEWLKDFEAIGGVEVSSAISF